MVEIKLHSGLTLIFTAGELRGFSIGVDTHRKGYAPRFYDVRTDDLKALARETMYAFNRTSGFRK